MTNPQKETAEGTQKNIVKCNFRSASRLSNEDARALTAIHETFARNLATALEAFLGTSIEVKLAGIDQMRLEEHIAGIPPLSYIVPFSMSSASATMMVECDVNLAFPMVDLLLGGPGGPVAGSRDLSEIEEEIMLDVFSLIARQAETSWRLESGALAAGKRLKPATIEQCCPPQEKVACLSFAVQAGEAAGSFQLVLPSVFLNLLLQQIKLDQPQKKAAVRYFPRQSLRERIVDCDVEVSVELPNLKVAVRDLLALLPGSVLKLRASVRTPGMLAAGGHGIFEATPVRNGSRKAAQLGRRIGPANLERV